VEKWHGYLGNPTYDAILDRLARSAYHVSLKGESMRKAGANKKFVPA